MTLPTRGPEPWRNHPTPMPAEMRAADTTIAASTCEADIAASLPFRVVFTVDGARWDADVTAYTADDAMAAVQYAYRALNVQVLGAINLNTIT